MSSVDPTRLMPVHEMRRDCAEDSALLQRMLEEATEFITSFEWCPKIRERYLGAGVGGVVAVFLFVFEEMIAGSDDRLWVVVGDLPSAYLVTDDAGDAKHALEKYCELMGDWIRAVVEGNALEDVFPVSAEPSIENAKLLEPRIEFLRKKLIPQL